MANTVLIMGESGTGKSTSIRNLNPAETFIVNTLDKPLPFRGGKKSYVSGAGGNYCATDNSSEIKKLIMSISKNKPEVKNIIIDDFQYLMANEYMRRAKEAGFNKFTDIGQSAWSIVQTCIAARDDLYVFLMSHTEVDQSGRVKCKTIGKMLDEKITFEGMFTVVLHTSVVDGHYKFLTQNDGTRIAKSPMGMFSDGLIDNDLLEIKKQMHSYYLADDEDRDAHVKAKIDDYIINMKKSKTMEDLQIIFAESYTYTKKMDDSKLESLKKSYETEKERLKK